MNRFIELCECIKFLGWSLGWRYWRIQATARRNPDLVLKWARDIQLTMPDNQDMLLWAELLEIQHAKWTAIQRFLSVKSPTPAPPDA